MQYEISSGFKNIKNSKKWTTVFGGEKCVAN